MCSPVNTSEYLSSIGRRTAERFDRGGHTDEPKRTEPNGRSITELKVYTAQKSNTLGE